MHSVRALHYLYLNYLKKNLLVAQDTSIQEGKCTKHKEHNTQGAVQLCLRSLNV